MYYGYGDIVSTNVWIRQQDFSERNSETQFRNWGLLNTEPSRVRRVGCRRSLLLVKPYVQISRIRLSLETLHSGGVIKEFAKPFTDVVDQGRGRGHRMTYLPAGGRLADFFAEDGW